MSRQQRIAIVGGGIAGLSAALALKAGGAAVSVYEQADVVKELGAGVGIGPNAWPLLADLGLGDQLRRVGAFSTGLIARRWNGDPVDGGNFSIGYCMCHRAELQQVLMDAVDPTSIHLGHRCVEIDEREDGVHLGFANGHRTVEDLVIGADGVRSLIRPYVLSDPSSKEIRINTGGDVAQYTDGVMAYRSLIPIERLPWAAENPTKVGMWMGPGRSFLTYPVSASKTINVVAFVPTTSHESESWTGRGEVSDVAAQYEGWDARVLETIAEMPETFLTGIFGRPALTSWTRGRVVLMGDAAHAMVPHLGQGATQAIEDAFALATLLSNIDRDDIDRALKIYETMRIPRTKLVQEKAREAGAAFRNNEKRDPFVRSGEVGNMDWIYNYDVRDAARTAWAAR